jgi:hypothetical protein
LIINQEDKTVMHEAFITQSLEAAADATFSAYDDHLSKRSITGVSQIAECAYKLHEILRNSSRSKRGLFQIDEFHLIKALRNFAVHQGLVSERSYTISTRYAASLRLDISSVCFINKAAVNKAINYEDRLECECDEYSKIAKIRNCLISVGEFYNVEPIVFNFMVKLFEMVNKLNIRLLSRGYKRLAKSYLYEKKNGYEHLIDYDQFKSMNFAELQSHIYDSETGEMYNGERSRLSYQIATPPVLSPSNYTLDEIVDIVRKSISREHKYVEDLFDLTSAGGIFIGVDDGAYGYFNIEEQLLWLKETAPTFPISLERPDRDEILALVYSGQGVSIATIKKDLVMERLASLLDKLLSSTVRERSSGKKGRSSQSGHELKAIRNKAKTVKSKRKLQKKARRKSRG